MKSVHCFIMIEEPVNIGWNLYIVFQNRAECYFTYYKGEIEL